MESAKVLLEKRLKKQKEDPNEINHQITNLIKFPLISMCLNHRKVEDDFLESMELRNY